MEDADATRCPGARNCTMSVVDLPPPVAAAHGVSGVGVEALRKAALHEVSSPPGEWPKLVYASGPPTPIMVSYAASAAVLGAAIAAAGAVVWRVRR
jgi:hypothetical protein